MKRNDVSRGMSAPRSRAGASRVATLTLPSLTVAVLLGVTVFAVATYPAVRLARLIEGAPNGSETDASTLGAANALAGVIHAIDDAFASAPSASAADGSPAVQAGVPGHASPRRDSWSTAALAKITQTEIVANVTAASPRELERRLAEERVAEARSMLQQAQAEQQRATNSPEAVALRAAERELASAQNTVTNAQQDLQRLNGPNPVILEAADREVQRAQATLRIIRTTRPPRDDPDAQSDTASALAAAQVALDEAVRRRDRLRAGPEPQQVERSQQALAAAQRQLEDARLRYDNAARSAPLPSLDAVDAAVIAAQRALYDAEAALHALWTSTAQGQVADPRDGPSRSGT